MKGRGEIERGAEKNVELNKKKKKRMWAGEMAQRLRALTALPEDPEFNSQQPHGGS